MKCRFWGVRGSIPSPASDSELLHKLKSVLMGASGVDLENSSKVDEYLHSIPRHVRGPVGGNTACIELTFDGNLFIFDAGSGLRRLGLKLMGGEFARGEGTVNMFQSHTHWDHIMGFPFFVPAYIKGNVINFYGCHEDLEERMMQQQDKRFFPISLDEMMATFNFNIFKEHTQHEICGALVTPFQMNHPGDSYGYRVEYNGGTFVYASDTEFLDMDDYHTNPLHNADILVLDTMYTFEDIIAKTHWGHCTPMIGVDLALRENVRKLVLFHHEPTYPDTKLAEMLEQTLKYRDEMDKDSDLEIILSYEGLELEI